MKKVKTKKQTALMGTDSACLELPIAGSRQRCVQPFGAMKCR
jgi:hypothetical protein